MPPTRQQSRARILRWERVVTGILNHFRWVRETGYRIFLDAYLLPRRAAYLAHRAMVVPTRFEILSDGVLRHWRIKRMRRERDRAPGGRRFPYYSRRQLASLGWDTDSSVPPSTDSDD